MLPKVVPIQQGLRDHIHLRLQRQSLVRQLRAVLQHHRVVRGIVSILAPAERRMSGHETRRYG